jgi:hypothetical protein
MGKRVVAQTKEQKSAAIRRSLAEYVAGQAENPAIETDPRYFAALASWCYKRDGDPSGLWWRSPGAGLTAHNGAVDDPLLAPANDGSTGYDAGVFYHTASRALIIVNRGTETERDWINNIESFLLIGGRQMPTARDYAVDVIDHARAHGLDVRVLVLTGQSLGGGLVQAQFCCLNRELAKQGKPAVATVHGLGFASAPFENFVRRMLEDDYGITFPTAAALDAAHPGLMHWIRRGDPIRSPTLYWGEEVVGSWISDLPEIYSISRNARWMTDRHGARQFMLQTGRNPAHDSYRYFLYLDRTAGQCVVVNTNGSDFPLETAVPPQPHEFNKIPDAYRRS